MTSKLVVNTIEADTGISSVSFASSISLSSTSVFHFGDATSIVTKNTTWAERDAAIQAGESALNNQTVKKLLWILWFAFATLTLNKTLGILYVNKNICYFAGISLAILHLYNLRYCQCTKKGCCVS